MRTRGGCWPWARTERLLRPDARTASAGQKSWYDAWNWTLQSSPVVRREPPLAISEPVVKVEVERVEALELLGMTLAHLNDAEGRRDLSPRVPLLMATRDKLAQGLREES